MAEMQSYETLRRLVRALAEELAGFRRRALAAEARVRELESRQPPVPTVSADPGLAARVVALEAETAELRRRIEAAGARAERIRSRVRFLRQQAEEAP
ncbi:MAG: hypothetical protein ACK53A_11270 [Gemmatimonadota bacterium]|nr:hypothetical protein [Gemmatimonadota bacterium]